MHWGLSRQELGAFLPLASGPAQVELEEKRVPPLAPPPLSTPHPQ